MAVWVKRIKYIVGTSLIVIALLITGIIVLGMFDPFTVFSVRNILTDLLFIGGSCLLGTFIIASAMDNRENKNKVMYYGIAWIGIAYLIGIIITLLSSSSLLRHGDMLIDQPSYKYNFVPLKTIATFITKVRNGELNFSSAVDNMVGNFIMFIPFSFMLPIIVKKADSFVKTIVITVGVIICLELLQLVLQSGSFDVDDIILNTIGAAAGYGLYKLRIVQRLLTWLNIMKE